ncbi:MAG: hypothetical protein IE916_07200 [Epsilonproteobacteria bacterium]|nr:hypothetical protein [Campylobacterota bacterium]
MNTNPTRQDITNRSEEIQADMRALFEENLKITDWNVPEANDKEAAKMLLALLKAEIAAIENDIENGIYNQG